MPSAHNHDNSINAVIAGEETKANLQKFSRNTFQDMRAAQIDGLLIQDNTVPVEW